MFQHLPNAILKHFIFGYFNSNLETNNNSLRNFPTIHTGNNNDQTQTITVTLQGHNIIQKNPNNNGEGGLPQMFDQISDSE